MAALYSETLKRAAAIAGGEQDLATRLRVTPSALSLWLSGAEKPPQEIFLRAVDIVTEHDVIETLVDTKQQVFPKPDSKQ